MEKDKKGIGKREDTRRELRTEDCGRGTQGKREEGGPEGMEYTDGAGNNKEGNAATTY